MNVLSDMALEELRSRKEKYTIKVSELKEVCEKLKENLDQIPKFVSRLETKTDH